MSIRLVDEALQPPHGFRSVAPIHHLRQQIVAVHKILVEEAEEDMAVAAFPLSIRPTKTPEVVDPVDVSADLLVHRPSVSKLVGRYPRPDLPGFQLFVALTGWVQT